MRKVIVFPITFVGEVKQLILQYFYVQCQFNHFEIPPNLS